MIGEGRNHAGLGGKKGREPANDGLILGFRIKNGILQPSHIDVAQQHNEQDPFKFTTKNSTYQKAIAAIDVTDQYKA